MWARKLLLFVMGVFGFCVAAPIVAHYATAWWWFSAPLIAAYAIVLWRWGLAWITDDAFKGASVFAKSLGVAGLLAWSFVGLTLAVYAVIWAAQYWPLIILSLLVVGLFVLGFWVSDLLTKKRKPPRAASPKTDDLVR